MVTFIQTQDLIKINSTTCFINIRGLRTNWDYLEHNLLTTSPQIFCVSETFLNSKIADELLTVPGYSFFRQDRSNDSGWGGLVVFYSDALTTTRMPDFEHLHHEMICLKLLLPGCLVFMFCIYRPPSDDDYVYDEISENIDTIQELHPKSEIIVLGALNAHHEDWLGSKKTGIHCGCAHEFAILNNLHQLVDDHTRIGKDGNCSKLDLFLTTSPYNHVVTVNTPLGSSDHCVVSTVANY